MKMEISKEQNGFSTEKQIELITSSEPDLEKQLKEATQI